mgnify:FL=1
MTRHTDTIDIGKGIQYAKVASRLSAFHEDNGTCEVTTTCEFKEGFALFSAIVTTKKGTFSGHSMGKCASLKAFEKLETIAVGRSLAFAGYLASGAIASQEEMDDVEEHDGITLAAFNDLKRAWLGSQGDVTGKTKNQLSVEFANWAVETTAGEIDIREAGDWKQWKQTDVDHCLEALTKETCDEDSSCSLQRL